MHKLLHQGGDAALVGRKGSPSQGFLFVLLQPHAYDHATVKKLPEAHLVSVPSQSTVRGDLNKQHKGRREGRFSSASAYSPDSAPCKYGFSIHKTSLAHPFHMPIYMGYIINKEGVYPTTLKEEL